MGTTLAKLAQFQHLRLNAVTRKDSYPLPRVDECLDLVAGSSWFSSLDLRSGYWQVPLMPETRSKTAFCTASDPQLAFVLDTDASGDGIGAVVSQLWPDREKVVAYYSKMLSKADKRYCVTRQELLAAVSAIRHFKYCLCSQHFTIHSDHASLQWLMTFKEPEGQECKYCEYTEAQELELSRKVDGNNEPKLVCRELREVDVTQWAEAQRRDPDLQPVILWIEAQQRPPWEEVATLSPFTKGLWTKFKCLRLIEGVLQRAGVVPATGEKRWQVVVPRGMQEAVLKGSGNFGVTNTLQTFYWGWLRHDVEDFCRRCDLCTACKGPQGQSRAQLQQFPVGEPMQREAVTVANALVEGMFSRFGVPQSIHSDQGRNFESKLPPLGHKVILHRDKMAPYRGTASPQGSTVLPSQNTETPMGSEGVIELADMARSSQQVPSLPDIPHIVHRAQRNQHLKAKLCPRGQGLHVYGKRLHPLVFMCKDKQSWGGGGQKSASLQCSSLTTAKPPYPYLSRSSSSPSVRVLIDSGVSGNFISSLSLKCFQLPYLPCNNVYQITTIQGKPLGKDKPLPPNPPEIISDDIYTVREILDSRQRGSRLQYLIDWEGYGPRGLPSPASGLSCSQTLRPPSLPFSSGRRRPWGRW
ncbi:hypothetical protein QQF64_012030 [Cirrhinus molitorella]|uniref:Chromo domain-containing protein n=1 Tax=Cirrhinus molitorella TaxID=172907 RepID=A0ABR3LVF8_9TELE